MNNSGYEPLLVHVLVLPDTLEDTVEGGVIIRPQQAQDREQRAGTMGTVVAIGPNAWGDYGDGEFQVNPGDAVVFKQYAGINFKGVDGKEYWLMHDKDILGKKS